MSDSPSIQAHPPALNANGRICILFDVIDSPSITYADAVDALSQECGAMLLPPPQWGRKGLAGAFSLLRQCGATIMLPVTPI